MHKHHKTWLGILILAIAFALSITLLTQPAKAPAPSVTLKGHTFAVTIADTTAARALGLSGTNKLVQDTGMLFVFQQPQGACFWMKDMRYNLDILWFDADHKLVKLEKNLSPETYPNSYCPDRDTTHVLELTAGTADSLELKLGDQITLPKQ